MAQLVIHLDNAILVQLKRKAWAQGLPFEESLRRLLAAAVSIESPVLADGPMVPVPPDGDTAAEREARICA